MADTLYDGGKEFQVYSKNVLPVSVYDRSELKQDNDLVLNSDSSLFLKNDKYVRLHLVQRAFGMVTRDIGSYLDTEGFERFITVRSMDRSLTLSDLDLITELYLKWRDQREFIPVIHTFAVPVTSYDPQGYELPMGVEPDRFGTFIYKDKNGLPCSCYKGYHYHFDEELEYHLRVTPKRGNSVYCALIKEKFSREFLDKEPLVFFDPAWGVKKTPMLYITGSVDPALHDLTEAWLNFGRYWNSFITNLRQKYKGGLVAIRTWQSQRNGYPHFHALVYFRKKEFTAVHWVEKDGTESFRLPSRSSDRNRIKSCWTHGFLDVVCVADTHTAFKDLLKYVLRDLEGGESDLTNAMVWFFHKQAFGVSKGFKELFGGALLEPSNADLINADRDNSNFLLVRIDVFPIIGDDLVPKTWQSKLGVPDPPDDLVALFGLLRAHCVCSESVSKRADGVPVFLWKEVDHR